MLQSGIHVMRPVNMCQYVISVPLRLLRDVVDRSYSEILSSTARVSRQFSTCVRCCCVTATRAPPSWRRPPSSRPATVSVDAGATSAHCPWSRNSSKSCFLVDLTSVFFSVERGSSAVECRTGNRESPGSNPLCYSFEIFAFSFSPRRSSWLGCMNEYLAIDGGGNVSE